MAGAMTETLLDLGQHILARKWQQSLTEDEWADTVARWKLITKDTPRLSWHYSTIASSSIATERVYREMVLEENFD